MPLCILVPFKLWMSWCEDPLLPSDLMYGTKETSAPACPQEYISEQKVTMQEISELVRSTMGKAASIQKAAHECKVLKNQRYRIGDWVWWYWLPGKADKLSNNTFVGPYKV